MADIDSTIRGLVETIKGYVDNAATLIVTTEGTVAAGAAGGAAQTRPIATTVLRLDGDATYTIPCREENGRLLVETDLLELHERSVKAATDYRAQLLGAFVEAVGTLTRPRA